MTFAWSEAFRAMSSVAVTSSAFMVLASAALAHAPSLHEGAPKRRVRSQQEKTFCWFFPFPYSLCLPALTPQLIQTSKKQSEANNGYASKSASSNL
jgi:hypothetical protein